jgi:hypothetical protein
LFLHGHTLMPGASTVMAPNSVWTLRVRPSRRRLSFIQSLHTRAHVMKLLHLGLQDQAGQVAEQTLALGQCRADLLRRQPDNPPFEPADLNRPSPQPLFASSLTTHSMTAIPCPRKV